MPPLDIVGRASDGPCVKGCPGKAIPKSHLYTLNVLEPSLEILCHSKDTGTLVEVRIGFLGEGLLLRTTLWGPGFLREGGRYSLFHDTRRNKHTSTLFSECLRFWERDLRA